MVSNANQSICTCKRQSPAVWGWLGRRLEFKCESIFEWPSPTLFPWSPLLATFLFVPNSVKKKKKSKPCSYLKLKHPCCLCLFNLSYLSLLQLYPISSGIPIISTSHTGSPFLFALPPPWFMPRLSCLVYDHSPLAVLPSASPFSNLFYICNYFPEVQFEMWSL